MSYILPCPSNSPVPTVITSGQVLTILNNTQVAHGTQIYVKAGGQIYTAGTGVLEWVS